MTQRITILFCATLVSVCTTNAYGEKKCPDDVAPATRLARDILGYDFISTEDIAVASGFTYSQEQVAELERTLPNKETLEWLHNNDFMLVAGPPRDMSLMDVRELKRSYFYENDGLYFHSDPFAYIEKVACRWYMLRKGIVPNSTRKMWMEQQKLLSDLETVPTAVEMVWGMTTYKAVRDVYLLVDIEARAFSAIPSDGYHIYVWSHGGDGIYVFFWPDGHRSKILGIASARKP